MSNLIHCDGPGCDRSFDPDGPEMSSLCEEPWIRVHSDGLPQLDFHSHACLVAWSSGKPVSAADGLPCMCRRAQTNPHSKADHQAYPTVADGR